MLVLGVDPGLFRPDALAIERIFFQKNLNTALGVVQATGVIQALAARRGLPVCEYAPTEVKSVVAGDGAADKEQVQFMVANLLGLKKAPSPADVADACGLALTYIAYNPKADSITGATDNLANLVGAKKERSS